MKQLVSVFSDTKMVTQENLELGRREREEQRNR